ncbi:uncharacterized protein LOC141853569 [Brevipalpus obovatus]|uniref:uncharacterized protein LOC141853569 n=1 Tax=Brevipalpus obovatus TaxID=246614 RepID=UPI003D9E69A7
MTLSSTTSGLLHFYTFLVLFAPQLILHLLNGTPVASGHIGQPCAFFGICWPPNIHIYCDDNNICQCRPETPVPVGPHACKRVKNFGDRCSTNDECLYSDNKSYCDQNAPEMKTCNCIANYTYDHIEMKCVHSTEHQKSFSSMFYMILSSAALWMILLLIALFVSIPCCLAFIYHFFCYDSSDPVAYRESSRHRGENGEESVRESLRQEDLVSRQSSFEFTAHDEPPPPYEEAIKNCPTSATVWIPETTADGPKSE